MTYSGVVLLTVGHSTATREDLSQLLRRAGVRRVVDVRTAPGSRRHPQFGRHELEAWMPEDGLSYRWEPLLGGFRRPSATSPNVVLRHPSFRGYADYMMTEPFAVALRSVLDEAKEDPTTVMCSEALWWRCHRRLIADAATLLFGAEVRHIAQDGRLEPHRPTEGARLGTGSSFLVYDEEDTPGDPACLAHLVCPACGGVTTEGHRPGCDFVPLADE